jgi:Fn3 associated
MDSIAQYQSDLVNLLLGNPALAVVPVSKFKEKVVADVADEAVNLWSDRSALHKVGLAIQVRIPAIRSRYPNVPGPQLEIEFTIRIFEDPVVNSTALTCEGVGLEVLSWLDGQVLEAENSSRQGIQLYWDDKQPALRPVYDYPDRFAYDAVLVAELPRDSIPRCILPDLAATNGSVTLTPSDPADVIYYTMDGSAPVIPVSADPANPAAAIAPTFLYAAPFAITNPDGTQVRWLAFRDGKRPSFVGQALITNP